MNTHLPPVQRNRAACVLMIVVSLFTGSCATVRELGTSINKAIKGQNLKQAFDQDKLKIALTNDTETISTSLKQLHREFKAKLTQLSNNIQERWGQKDVKVASPTKYVKYSDSYKSRAIVDFDNGKVIVETLNDIDSTRRLQQGIITTLLTPSDPQSIDLFSDKSVTLDQDTKPYLQGLILDHRGKSIQTLDEAEQYANFLLQNKTSTRKGSSDSDQNAIRYVRINMVKNFESKKAEPYRPFVTASARKYKISSSLIYAIIKTESNFNPYAVSSAPAYGLMQLVPTSGGRDAYRRAKGLDKVPSPNFLFKPENNIELGTAYLNVLTYKEMKQIADPVARDYCVIAAYNTGPGNLFKTFSKDRKSAVKEINQLSPSALYKTLRTSLPYQETRHYIKKVVKNRKNYGPSPHASL